MHRLLERQLVRQFGSLEPVPNDLATFLEEVSASYTAADDDRHLLERSLELTSQELLQANSDLRAKQREQRAIFDSVPAMIIYKDTRNRILRLNEVAAKALGGTAASLEGKDTADLFPPDVAARMHDDDLEVVSSGLPKLGIVESHPSADGQLRWVRTDKVPYRDDAGNVIGVVVLAVDITDRKVAEEALRASEERLKAAYAELQKVDRERTQFINNAAHELGTPLTPIKLQIHAVKNRLESGTDVEQLRGVQILERNFERLSSLVKDLLDAARLQSDNLRLMREPTDLRSVVRQAVETFREALKVHSLALDCDLPGPVQVDADPFRLGQVMDNLLSNAIKFTPPGGRITLRCSTMGGEAEIRVTDTGMGIAPAQIQRLFKPFSQVHDIMRHAAGGTGLGLYISRGIVARHGGTMGVESDGLGHGATFWLRLPLATSVKVASPGPGADPALPGIIHPVQQTDPSASAQPA